MGGDIIIIIIAFARWATGFEFVDGPDLGLGAGEGKDFGLPLTFDAPFFGVTMSVTMHGMTFGPIEPAQEIFELESIKETPSRIHKFYMFARALRRRERLQSSTARSKLSARPRTAISPS